MTDNMVEITVEVLNILAIATKELRQSRASKLILHLRSLEADMMDLEKFLKRVVGVTSLEDVVMKLDKLTNVGARMASIEVLRHIIDKNVIDIGDYARVVEEKVQSVDDKVQDVGDKVQSVGDKVQSVGNVGAVIRGTQLY